MTISYMITSPQDLGNMFRDYGETCEHAARTASGRHQRELWLEKAAIWKAAAGIASACVFKSEGDR